MVHLDRAFCSRCHRPLGPYHPVSCPGEDDGPIVEFVAEVVTLGLYAAGLYFLVLRPLGSWLWRAWCS